jgi:hypothetical protein
MVKQDAELKYVRQKWCTPQRIGCMLLSSGRVPFSK